jgi:tetratricopeptide (TPR) repeat protein
MPTFLSLRRMAILSKAGLNTEAAKLAIKADARLFKKDVAGARQALEKATDIDNGFVPAHLRLASMYEAEGQWKAAIDRYRRVLATQPNHPNALNNLAYALTEHADAAAEALPLAKQAYEVTKGSPIVGDTLAWVYHRLNRDAEAEPLATLASQKAPRVAIIQLHAAVVFAAVGKTKEAGRALQTALALDKGLEEQAEVVQLKRRLEGSK